MMGSERNQFLGAWITERTKNGLIREGGRRSKSLSLLVSDILEDWLTKNTKAEVVRLPGERKLPLED